MTLARRYFTFISKMIVFAALLNLTLVAQGCWDDDCPEGCDAGYACYYGVCLSRGFCPLGTTHSDNCAQWETEADGSLTCVQRVEHGICERGYVCVCDGLEPGTDRCVSRSCQFSTE